jgi:hypothetical protein
MNILYNVTHSLAGNNMNTLVQISRVHNSVYYYVRAMNCVCVCVGVFTVPSTTAVSACRSMEIRVTAGLAVVRSMGWVRGMLLEIMVCGQHQAFCLPTSRQSGGIKQKQRKI